MSKLLEDAKAAWFFVPDDENVWSDCQFERTSPYVCITDKLAKFAALQQPQWISVKTGLPAKNKTIYFYANNQIYYGSFVTETNSENETEENFIEYNAGYDGDSETVYRVTHWMYEMRPSPPTNTE